MDGGAVQKIQAQVQIVSNQDCPWKSQLRPEQTFPAPEPTDRWRFPRHQISFPQEIRDERVNTPMRVSAIDISGKGC